MPLRHTRMAMLIALAMALRWAYRHHPAKREDDPSGQLSRRDGTDGSGDDAAQVLDKKR